MNGRRRKRFGRRQGVSKAFEKRSGKRTHRLMPGHELVMLLAFGLACYQAFQHGSRLHLHRVSRYGDDHEGTDFALFLNLGEEDVIELPRNVGDALLVRVKLFHLKKTLAVWNRIRELDAFLEKAGLCGRKIDALRLDGTSGHVGWKIDKNQEHREKKGAISYWTWGIGVQVADETTIIRMMDDHKNPEKPEFLGSEHFNRLEELAKEGAVRFSPTDICPVHGEKCPLIPKLEAVWRYPVFGKKFPRDWRGRFPQSIEY